MIKKIGSVLIVMALLLSLFSLTACFNDDAIPGTTPPQNGNGGGDVQSPGGGNGDNNRNDNLLSYLEQEAARRAALTGELNVWIRGWDNWGLVGGTPEDPYYEYFREQFPNVVLNLQINRDWHYLTEAIASGDAPDLFFWEGLPPNVFRNMIEQGFVAPLDDFLSRDSVFTDQFLPGMLEMHRFEGHIYGLPIDVMPNAILLNLDIFDLRNVPYPNNDWTIDDVVSLAGRLTNKTDLASPSVGIVRNVDEQDYIRMLNFFTQAHDVVGYRMDGGQRVSNLAEDQGAITAIQQYIEVQANNYANTFSYEERVALGLDTSVWNIDWAAGVGGMFVGAGPWGMEVNNETREPLFTQTVMPPPVGANGGRGNFVSIIGMSIFEGSNNKELAWEFLKAMTCREFREAAWTINDAGERIYPLRFDENSYRFGWGLPAYQIDESRLTGFFRDWYLGFKAASAFPAITAMNSDAILDVTRDVESGTRQLVDALREYDDYVNANNLLAEW
ncbi:MAG: extracellular solute-binding protein [Oscillospiraceae bacterium]|nr:extracellular solute-binding protein [Oscillospiraceae bacterium]